MSRSRLSVTVNDDEDDESTTTRDTTTTNLSTVALPDTPDAANRSSETYATNDTYSTVGSAQLNDSPDLADQVRNLNTLLSSPEVVLGNLGNTSRLQEGDDDHLAEELEDLKRSEALLAEAMADLDQHVTSPVVGRSSSEFSQSSKTDSPATTPLASNIMMMEAPNETSGAVTSTTFLRLTAPQTAKELDETYQEDERTTTKQQPFTQQPMTEYGIVHSDISPETLEKPGRLTVSTEPENLIPAVAMDDYDSTSPDSVAAALGSSSPGEQTDSSDPTSDDLPLNEMSELELPPPSRREDKSVTPSAKSPPRPDRRLVIAEASSAFNLKNEAQDGSSEVSEAEDGDIPPNNQQHVAVTTQTADPEEETWVASEATATELGFGSSLQSTTVPGPVSWPTWRRRQQQSAAPWRTITPLKRRDHKTAAFETTESMDTANPSKVAKKAASASKPDGSTVDSIQKDDQPQRDSQSKQPMTVQPTRPHKPDPDSPGSLKPDPPAVMVRTASRDFSATTDTGDSHHIRLNANDGRENHEPLKAAPMIAGKSIASGSLRGKTSSPSIVAHSIASGLFENFATQSTDNAQRCPESQETENSSRLTKSILLEDERLRSVEASNARNPTASGFWELDTNDARSNSADQNIRIPDVTMLPHPRSFDELEESRQFLSSSSPIDYTKTVTPPLLLRRYSDTEQMDLPDESINDRLRSSLTNQISPALTENTEDFEAMWDNLSLNDPLSNDHQDLPQSPPSNPKTLKNETLLEEIFDERGPSAIFLLDQSESLLPVPLKNSIDEEAQCNESEKGGGQEEKHCLRYCLIMFMIAACIWIPVLIWWQRNRSTFKAASFSPSNSPSVAPIVDTASPSLVYIISNVPTLSPTQKVPQELISQSPSWVRFPSFSPSVSSTLLASPSIWPSFTPPRTAIPTLSPTQSDQSPSSLVSTTTSPTSPLSSTSQPTAALPVSLPTSAPSATLPTTAPSESVPTAAPSAAEPTTAPTVAIPTAAPFVALPTSTSITLLDFISANSPDNGTALQNQGSPQFQAFEWLSNNREVENYSERRLLQRYSLASLYFSTDGANWAQSDGWLSDENECEWFGRSFEACGPDNEFKRLELYYNNLSGSLPAELSLMTHLQKLDLSGGPTKSLQGSVPSAIGALTSLQELKLQNNDLTGALPTECGQLTELKVLDMSYNRLSGTLISEIGRLTHLQVLRLSMNGITGTIPVEIRNNRYLITLGLENNLLTGHIHSALGQLTRLQSIHLDNNRLQSNLPTSIGNLRNLMVLSLSRNSLSGSLPHSLGKLTNLIRLSMSRNSLSGQIPNALSNLKKLTEELDLSFNSFSGTIPRDLGEIDGNLRVLKLNNNALTGTLPTSFVKFTRLNLLKLESNDLTGSMPTSACRLFNETLPSIFIDCSQVDCPCCNYCCTDEQEECTCRYKGTAKEWMCYF